MTAKSHVVKARNKNNEIPAAATPMKASILCCFGRKKAKRPSRKPRIVSGNPKYVSRNMTGDVMSVHEPIAAKKIEASGMNVLRTGGSTEGDAGSVMILYTPLSP